MRLSEVLGNEKNILRATLEGYYWMIGVGRLLGTTNII